MLNYIPFYVEMWSDKKFRNLTPNKDTPEGYGKLIFNYLFTNHSVTLTGIYTFDIEEARMRIPIRDFDLYFNEVINSNMVKWDKENEIVFVVNRFKYIPNNKSPKIIEGAIKELNKLTHLFKQDFMKKYSEYFGDYKPIFKDFKDTEINLLTQDQIDSWIKLGWQKIRIKRFYMDRNYSEQKIDEIINQFYPNLK